MLELIRIIEKPKTGTRIERFIEKPSPEFTIKPEERLSKGFYYADNVRYSTKSPIKQQFGIDQVVKYYKEGSTKLSGIAVYKKGECLLSNFESDLIPSVKNLLAKLKK